MKTQSLPCVASATPSSPRSLGLCARLLLLAGTLLGGAPAVQAATETQMPIPAHNSPFTGNVRGYWFTAPVDFQITGLEVPTEAGSGLQSIAVVRLEAAPPLYSGTTNAFTQLYLTQDNPTEGKIIVAIPVHAGEIIGILGCRGTSNSYAQGLYPSEIFGQSVTLSRLGMQYPLPTTTPRELWTENGGSISRVRMYYSEPVPEIPTIVLANDAVTSTVGGTRVYPLANDPVLATPLTIASVSEPTVTISADRRSLVVPAGFTGSFTYRANSGTEFGRATVEVTAGTPVSAPIRYVGLLYNASGAVAGWSSVGVSARGSGSAQVMVGLGKGRAQFGFKSTETTATATTAIGVLTVTRNPDGTLGVSLAGDGGPYTANLRPAAKTTTAKKYHVALASIDSGIPGGGYAVVNVKATGLATISGLLPDGRPFRAGTNVADNGTLSVYAVESKFVVPPGIVAGELVSADLQFTDVTGEFFWNKPTQGTGAKGHHLSGVNTVLLANGSIYSGAITLNGPGTLTLSGGNLAATQTDATAVVTGGIPALPLVDAPALKAWAGVKATVGQFRAKVVIPGFTKPQSGGGVYLPKANKAWGYFPGTTLGGRIELSVPITGI